MRAGQAKTESQMRENTAQSLCLLRGLLASFTSLGLEGPGALDYAGSFTCNALSICWGVAGSVVITASQAQLGTAMTVKGNGVGLLEEMAALSAQLAFDVTASP